MADKLQDQVQHLQKVQNSMERRLQECDTKYTAVLNAINQFRANMAAQDELVRDIAQRVTKGNISTDGKTKTTYLITAHAFVNIL